RVQLGVGRRVGAVVLLVAPAGDVATLPLIRLACRLPRGELVHEVLRVGGAQAVVVHLQVAVEDHGLHEAAAAQAARLDRVDQFAKRVLLHGFSVVLLGRERLAPHYITEGASQSARAPRVRNSCSGLPPSAAVSPLRLIQATGIPSARQGATSWW